MHLLRGLSRVILDEGLAAEGVAAARGAEYEALAQSLKNVQLADVAKGVYECTRYTADGRK